MEIRILDKNNRLTQKEFLQFAEHQFEGLVKATVDIEKQIIALGGELHADSEALLLQQSSRQEHLWGINLYPESKNDAFIEFNSLINLRPGQGNFSRFVEDPEIRKKIRQVVKNLILIK